MVGIITRTEDLEDIFLFFFWSVMDFETKKKPNHVGITQTWIFFYPLSGFFMVSVKPWKIKKKRITFFCYSKSKTCIHYRILKETWVFQLQMENATFFSFL